MIHYLDAHAHHQHEANAAELVREALAAGIEKIGLGGTHPADWKQQVELHHQFRGKLVMHFGLHPWWVEQYSRTQLEDILSQLDRELPLVSGLGETGLDFFPAKRDPSRFDDQRWIFREQIRLALKYEKPIVLHVVQAHEEAMKIIREEDGARVPLILHRFSGNGKQLKGWLSLGSFISFHEAKKLMGDCPLDRLLLETDSNSKHHPGGWDVRPHYEKTAEIIGLSVEELAKKVAENFDRIGYSPSP